MQQDKERNKGKCNKQNMLPITSKSGMFHTHLEKNTVFPRKKNFSL